MQDVRKNGFAGLLERERKPIRLYSPPFYVRSTSLDTRCRSSASAEYVRRVPFMQHVCSMLVGDLVSFPQKIVYVGSPMSSPY